MVCAELNLYDCGREEGELPPRVRNYYYGQLGKGLRPRLCVHGEALRRTRSILDIETRTQPDRGCSSMQEPARMKLSPVTEAAAIFKTQDERGSQESYIETIYYIYK